MKTLIKTILVKEISAANISANVMTPCKTTLRYPDHNFC